MKKLLLITLTLSLFSASTLKATVYYLKNSGAITILGSWGTNPDGTGTSPLAFTGTHTWNIRNQTPVALAAAWGVAPAATVNIGDGTTALTFSLNASGKIGSTTGAAVTINNNATYIINGGLNSSAAKTTFATGSIFTTGSSNVGGVPADSYDIVNISQDEYLAGDVTVNGTLTIASGFILDEDAYILTLNNAIAGTGMLAAGTTATLVLNGTGNIGNLLFITTNPNTGTSGKVLSSLTVSLTTAASIVTLGSDSLTVNDQLTLTSGKLDISGKHFIVNGAITATSGTLVGSSTTSLSIGGTGVISGTLNGLTALSALTLNRTGETLRLGSNLTISAATTLTNGNLGLNGTLLTTNGALTFGAGFLTGSLTSSLTIGGAGTITNPMFMTQTTDTTRALSALTLNRAQTLTIGNALNIYNSITPTLGTIALGTASVTLKSSAATKARVGVVGGAFTGTIKVETFIPGGTAGWNTVGPAGISGLTVTNWDGGSGSSTAFAMTCSGCINSENSAGGHFVSIQSDPLGDGVYTELTSTSPLTPGVGYWAFIGADLTTAIEITQTTTGPVVTGNVASGTGFMSNPYASPLSHSSLQGSNPGLGAVDVYNANAGAYTSFNGGIPSDIIPMGQGFYANGISAVTFFEANKIASNNSMLKTAAATSIGTVFQLKIEGWYGDYDNTYVRFHNDATPAFDLILDAYKRYATPGYLGYPGPYQKYTTIATVNTNQDYAINSLPFAKTTDAVIPVIAKASATGQYTISPVDIQNLPPAACVILKDKLLNVNHDLRTGSYIFNMADTTSAARFELTICADLTTSIKPLQANNNNVLIGQDGAAGVFVKTTFDKSTKSVISAYNVMGQKIIADKEIEGSQNLVYLDFNDLHNQIIIIKVTNDKGQTTKKVFLK